MTSFSSPLHPGLCPPGPPSLSRWCPPPHAAAVPRIPLQSCHPRRRQALWRPRQPPRASANPLSLRSSPCLPRISNRRPPLPRLSRALRPSLRRGQLPPPLLRSQPENPCKTFSVRRRGPWLQHQRWQQLLLWRLPLPRLRASQQLLAGPRWQRQIFLPRPPQPALSRIFRCRRHRRGPTSSSSTRGLQWPRQPHILPLLLRQPHPRASPLPT
mmetsp:Transcript_3688/g.10615  ORF Transcript_3688/g.10615 Transcript_3688/m.10615 type:complete len:213 (-) Transcript_3688:1253-1891(-)